MSQNAIVAEYRDINTITQTFKVTLAQAQRMALSYVVQLGQLMTEAKELLNDSKEFERWLTEEVSFKKSAAYNYMRIAEAYGTDQTNFFGDVKNSKLSGLNYSQALALLAIPDAEEREQFAEEHHVEDMSARELKKALAERDAAIEHARQAEMEKNDALSGKADAEKALKVKTADFEAKMSAIPDTSELEKRAKTAEENSTRVEKMLESAKKTVEKVQKEAEAAEAKSAELQKEIEKLKKDPIIPVEVLEKVSAEAAEHYNQQVQEQIEKLRADNEAAKAEAEALKKKLAQSNEEVTIFRTYLTDVQTTLNKLSGLILKVEGRDAELAKKLKAAEKSILTGIVEKL